jgi:hypothetical protein
MNNVVANILRFIVFLALQIFIFNNIKFLGFINPQVYLIPLLLLPLEMKKWIQYLIAFTTGFIIDMFFNVYGIHALAALIIVFLRPYWVFLINGFRPVEGVFKPIPGEKDFNWLLIFVFGITFLHQLIVSLFETFKMSEFIHILWITIVNSIFTTIVILSIFYLFYSEKKKK